MINSINTASIFLICVSLFVINSRIERLEHMMDAAVQGATLEDAAHKATAFMDAD